MTPFACQARPRRLFAAAAFVLLAAGGGGGAAAAEPAGRQDTANFRPSLVAWAPCPESPQPIQFGTRAAAAPAATQCGAWSAQR